MERYDAEAAYDEKIFPLMAQILDVCKQHEIPMLATFQLTNAGEDPTGEGNSLWCTSLLAEFPHGNNATLKKCSAVLQEVPFSFSYIDTKQ